MNDSRAVAAITNHFWGQQAMATNGTVAQNGHRSAVSAPSLSDVDRLHALREQLRQLTAQERELTGRIVAALQHEGGRFAHGTLVTAILDYRHSLKPDVPLFIEAVGGIELAAPALTVKVEAARHLVAGDVLTAISETMTTPYLRVEARS